MESHARLLLERLNTSASPKASSPTTVETKSLATDIARHLKEPETSFRDEAISPLTQCSAPATLEGPEAVVPVKDVPVPRRRCSHKVSLASGSQSGEDNHTTDNSSETIARGSLCQQHTVLSKDPESVIVNTSDGDSSAHPEESLNTPSGSNNSSLVSNDAENMHVPTSFRPSNLPQGLYIAHEVPCKVTLPRLKPHIPRLQIRTDSTGQTFPGEGIEQIAALVRNFSVYDRDIIGATTKYIVYALKGFP